VDEMETQISFTAAPIVIPPLTLSSAEVGACVEFQGIVRELEKDVRLRGLFYEAYEPMASRHLERIFKTLNARHPCHAVVFIHRLGWVPVGQASLFIRVLAAHRGEALAFCAAAIDEMKVNVPIWKTGEGSDVADHPRIRHRNFFRANRAVRHRGQPHRGQRRATSLPFDHLSGRRSSARSRNVPSRSEPLSQTDDGVLANECPPPRKKVRGDRHFMLLA